jgi:pimeloyl-ACP methyl ester carboxylesterase
VLDAAGANAYDHTNDFEEIQMSNFVLVHGSWHGAWCWYKIVPRLRALGHHVEAVDLPSHGRDWTAPADVTLDNYVERIHEAIDRAPGPVVVVAHSRGGLAATQAAEGRHEQINTLVYLAAFVPRNGESVLDILTTPDTDSLIPSNLDFAPDGSWDMLRAEAFETALYADCSDEDVALAHMLLTPEPFTPTRTPMVTSDERYGRIPRVYIELLEDRAVSPALQKRMYMATPCEEVRSIEASHSAYFSKPDELTTHLDAIAARAPSPAAA